MTSSNLLLFYRCFDPSLSLLDPEKQRQFLKMTLLPFAKMYPECEKPGTALGVGKGGGWRVFLATPGSHSWYGTEGHVGIYFVTWCHVSPVCRERAWCWREWLQSVGPEGLPGGCERNQESNLEGLERIGQPRDGQRERASQSLLSPLQTLPPPRAQNSKGYCP